LRLIAPGAIVQSFGLGQSLASLLSSEIMNIKYFQDTDTLYTEFKTAEVVESKELDENTILDLEQDGNICGMTIEHASRRANIPRFSYEQVAA